MTFRGSFRRDYKAINDRQLIRALKEKINEMKKAKDPGRISRFKRLRKFKRLCKTEVVTDSGKIYWVLGVLSGNRPELVRVKYEAYFKKRL